MSKISAFFAPLGAIGFVAYIGLILAGIVGWFMNIFDLIAMADGGITTMFVLRCVGVFVFPLGGVLGYF